MLNYEEMIAVVDRATKVKTTLTALAIPLQTLKAFAVSYGITGLSIICKLNRV